MFSRLLNFHSWVVSMVPKDFKWRHFVPDVILQCLRWYLRYPLSYRNLEEMMSERGVEVDHTTIYRWIQHFSPEFEKRIRWYTKPLGFSWRVDETYIKIKGKWKYLYRAIDNRGQTIDFMLSHKRDAASAKHFFRKAIKHCHEVPLTINTDKNPNYPQAIDELKREGVLSPNLEHLQVKYLNNIIESDHRRVKRRTTPMMGFQSFKTANRTLKGVEAMAMMIKQQNYYLKTSLQGQIKFVNELFGIYA